MLVSIVLAVFGSSSPEVNGKAVATVLLTEFGLPAAA